MKQEKLGDQLKVVSTHQLRNGVHLCEDSGTRNGAKYVFLLM